MAPALLHLGLLGLGLTLLIISWHSEAGISQNVSRVCLQVGGFVFKYMFLNMFQNLGQKAVELEGIINKLRLAKQDHTMAAWEGKRMGVVSNMAAGVMDQSRAELANAW
jgi:hypothetical protein